MSLLGNKHDVTLSVDPLEVVAGEPLRVRATFPAADRHTHGARLELLYRNTYRHDVREAGDPTTRGTVHTTDDVGMVRLPVELSQSAPTEVDVPLTIAAEAPASAPKLVEWEVRAIVDRKRARDTHTAQRITVHSPSTALAEWTHQPQDSSVDWPLSLDAPSRTVKPGERITGHLVFTPAETISAKAVRVQLHRKLENPDGNVSQDTDVQVQLLGKGDLPAGVSQSLPFEITVPADASPSFLAAHNRQHWWLEGVIDVPHHSDPRVGLEILVHGG